MEVCFLKIFFAFLLDFPFSNINFIHRSERRIEKKTGSAAATAFRATAPRKTNGFVQYGTSDVNVFWNTLEPSHLCIKVLLTIIPNFFRIKVLSKLTDKEIYKGWMVCYLQRGFTNFLCK